MRRFFVLLALALSTGTALADDWIARQKLKLSFEDAKDAITLAIESKGLVINYTAHIANMLDRTGADLGTSRRVYEKAEVIEFCSAKLSRQMMEADPHNIVLCPFAISIYSLPGEPNTTWVSYRKPQGNAAKLVGPLLQEIAAEAGR
jgi:uncharacterized protein (DUF302 family)